MAEPTRPRALAGRWLGLGLATVVAVVTLGLGLTGRLTLYISPDTVWFACAAAALLLVVAVWSCTVPLGAEGDHDHTGSASAADAGAHRRRILQTAGVVTGGVVASAVVLAALMLPPASLSAQLAVSRAGDNPGLFAGADDVTLGVADTTTFGIGDWASAFATSTRPEEYDGASVTLTGFVTPGEADAVGLTRMMITHCVIDAQPATVPVGGVAGEYETGQWIEVTGAVRADADGTLRIEPTSVKKVAEPKDPYEY
ncbi:TIGR03943 family protein [Microbacterium sp. ARD32]|nr:TIGR03943 family protein [Microbacterium sp. ARD32]MDT0157899.1 TIGR03943 family protein [Microbacterium sp. ARD32]